MNERTGSQPVRTIKLVTCRACHGKRTITVTLTGGSQLRVPCRPCTGSGKVIKRP